MTDYPDDPTAAPDDIPDTDDPTVQHAMISAESVAAAAGDGSDLPPQPDPYDVENPDEVDPDPGPAGMPPPDFTSSPVQDTGDSPDAA